MSSSKILQCISVMEYNDIDMFALISRIIEHCEAGDESFMDANISLKVDSTSIIELLST
jgi:hypothetical protein